MRLGRNSGWSHGCDPPTHCRLGRALTLRFVTLAVRSLSRLTKWCSTRQVLLVKRCLRVLTTRVSRAPPVLRRLSWPPRVRVIQLAIGAVALCSVSGFGHRCLKQARVSVDTCKERRATHEHVCGSIEFPFCFVLVRWSKQVKCGSASPFCVVSAAQGLSAQILFRLGEVGPPCSCHVLFGRKGLGRSRKRSPVTVSSP